jgi:small subunit ribosomal protein S3
MGQKVHPYGFRLGIIRDWQSRWYADKEYQVFAVEDHKIRRYLRSRLPSILSAGGGNRRPGGRGGRGMDAGVSQIEIERMANMVKVTLHTARPGLIIGRGGRGIDELRAEVEAIIPRKVQINVLEIKQPELDAQLVADSIANQIERRVSFKRAIRLAIARTMQRGGKGIKVLVGGRLGGAEIARSYGDKDGKIPLHTLRADIDYGVAEASTTYGNIGVKVWIYRGEILPGATAGAPRPAVARPAAPMAPTTPSEAADKKAKGWRRVARPDAAHVSPEAETESQPAPEVSESVTTFEATTPAAEAPAVTPESIPTAETTTDGSENA